MKNKFTVTEIVSMKNLETGEEWKCNIKPVSLEEFNATVELHKPTLEDLIKTCPPLYPLNNDLRRNHKATIGKELRSKRDDERYDWWRKNKFEIFDAAWDELNEYLAGNIENGFWNDITTVDEIEIGDKNTYESAR